MSEDTYKAAFTASADAIFVLRPIASDGDGFDAEIVAVNPGAHALIARAFSGQANTGSSKGNATKQAAGDAIRSHDETGSRSSTPDGLVGARLSQTLAPENHRPLGHCLARAAATGCSTSCEISWRGEGPEPLLRATVCPVTNGLVLFLTDIGELYRARHEIERQRREFASASKMMATHAAHLAEAAAAAEAAQAALLEEIDRREKLERELQRMARTDALTGVLNRRGFTAEAKRLVNAAERYGTQLSVIIVDADHFKGINDTHGHAAGDAALAHLARFLTNETRTGVDVIGRMGGEEFVLVLPHTDARGAAALAERLRAGLAATAIPELRGFRMTASFGVATLAHGESSLSEVMRRADVALYRAKRAGRNQVALADQDDAAAA